MKLLVAFVLWTILILQFEINQAARSVLNWNKHLQDFEHILVEPSLESEKKERALRAQVEETTASTDFKQILVKPSLESEKEEHALRTRAEETHNFNGQVLRLTYFEEYGMVHFYENDSKITGVAGDIWTMLSEMLNFTLIVTRSESDSLGMVHTSGGYDGILQLVRINHTDIIPKVERFQMFAQSDVYFTQSMWTTKFSHWTRARKLEHHNWMFNVFSVEVWILISVYILILSAIRAVAERAIMRKTDRNIQPRSYLDHFFNTFGIMCNQGDVLSPRSGSRIVAITISLFSWLILIVYGSRLITNLTQNNFQPSITYIGGLLGNNASRYIARNGSYGHIYLRYVTKPRFVELRKLGRITAVSDLDHMYNEICSNWDKTILFDGEDMVVARSSRFCNLVPVIGAQYSTDRYGVASSINRRVKNKRSFDIGLMKLREFGIMDALKKRHWYSKRRAEENREAESLVIGMNQVAYIFAILACGIVASMVIWIAEHIVIALKDRKVPRRPILRNPPKIRGSRY